MPLIFVLAAAAMAEAGAGTVAVAALAAVAPMTPSSKWNVDYGATACVLGRVYGTGKDETLLALRQVPLGSELDLMIYANDRSRTMRLGKASVSIANGGSDQRNYESYPTRVEGKRITRIAVDIGLFKALPADAVLRIAPDKMAGWAFVLPNAKAAFEALATCNDSTVKRWGIDPTERTRIAQPAEPARSAGYPGNWISTEDYPEMVISRGAQGTSIILWTIGLDGGVTDCRTMVSSGEVELDKAACIAITRHGRYTPALGFDGKPMISHMSRNVTWRLPGTWSGEH